MRAQADSLLEPSTHKGEGVKGNKPAARAANRASKRWRGVGEPDVTPPSVAHTDAANGDDVNPNDVNPDDVNPSSQLQAAPHNLTGLASQVDGWHVKRPTPAPLECKAPPRYARGL